MIKQVKGPKLPTQLIGIGVISVLLLYIYGMYIEPQLLMTRHITITSPYVQRAIEGLKIVQFTDTQLGDFYTEDDLERVVDAINEVQPDIVVFTGDLIDHMRTYEGDTDYIADRLGEIQAKYGKYAVYGNHDQGGGAHKVYHEIMNDAGFKLLVNEIATVQVDAMQVNIIGIDDWLLGYPQLDETLATINKDAYNIVLIHEPDVADLVSRYAVDLQLSGHTHGGQVQLPWIGPIVTPPSGHKYTQGLYELTERHKVYVSTGLGNTRMQFRLMNIPEIAVFTLQAS